MTRNDDTTMAANIIAVKDEDFAFGRRVYRNAVALRESSSTAWLSMIAKNAASREESRKSSKQDIKRH